MFRGERIAEVWFKPEGDPLAPVFRIPRGSFQDPGIAPRLTAENLLKAVAVAADAVESWRPGGAAGSDPDLARPLPEPPPGADHLEVHFRLKPPTAAAADGAGREPAAVAADW